MCMYRVNETIKPDFIAFDQWLFSMGRSATTGWRWRKRGWLTALNISGRIYIHRDEIDRFTARVQRGEFAKITTVPGKKEAAP